MHGYSMANVYTTLGDAPVIREDWLQTDDRPRFGPISSRSARPCPRRFAFRAVFPRSPPWPNKARRIGECWGVESSEDKSFQVFISPLLKESVEVTATLVHELVHTAVGIECKHRGPFLQVAKAIGLEGKMTATVAGDVAESCGSRN